MIINNRRHCDNVIMSTCMAREPEVGTTPQPWSHKLSYPQQATSCNNIIARYSSRAHAASTTNSTKPVIPVIQTCQYNHVHNKMFLLTDTQNVFSVHEMIYQLVYLYHRTHGLSGNSTSITVPVNYCAWQQHMYSPRTGYMARLAFYANLLSNSTHALRFLQHSNTIITNTTKT